MPLVFVTPATASRLTTAQNVRTDLGLSQAAAPDDRLNRLIDQASQRAATFCRRRFGRETVRERLFATDCWGSLLLSRDPVVSVASVTADGATLVTGDYELASSEAGLSYLYRLSGGARRLWGAGGADVQYVTGYRLPGEPAATGVPDLPADLERAVIQLVGMALSQAGRDLAVKSENVDGVGSTDWYVQGATAALPHPEAEATLTGYRRMFLA